MEHEFYEEDRQFEQRITNEIQSIPLLDREEEVTLIKSLRDSVRQLRRHNLRYVFLIARQYVGQGLTLQRLVYEGNKGLLKAAEHFDEHSDYKFISYATWWIRQSILSALAATGGGAAPQNLRLSEQEVMTVYRNGKSFAEIGMMLGIPEERAEQIYNKALRRLMPKID